MFSNLMYDMSDVGRPSSYKILQVPWHLKDSNTVRISINRVLVIPLLSDMSLLPYTLVLFLSLFSSSVFAAFGLTTSTSSYVLDAGSSNSLVVTVSRASCDITSIKYRGEELQYTGTYSHISSGLGTATVTATTISGVCRSYVLHFTLRPN